MTRIKRIYEVIIGLLQLLIGIGLIQDPVSGVRIAAFLLSLTVTVRGIQTLLYYFSMARMMVGGKRTLFLGLFYLDLGLITSSVASSSAVIIMLYMFILHLVYAVIDIMRSREAKSMGSPAWKGMLIYGINNLLIAVAVLVGNLVFKSVGIVIMIYGAGLAYTACVRIVTAFRKTAIVYIQ